MPEYFDVRFRAPDDKLGALLRYLYSLPGISEVSAVPAKGAGSARRSGLPLPARLLQQFKPGQPFKRRDVIAAFPDVSNVDTTLYNMVKDGTLNRIETGTYQLPARLPAPTKALPAPKKKAKG
jgi:hypothetical protein